MKRLSTDLAIGLVALALPVAACSAHASDGSDIQPSGSGGERRFAVSGFDTVGLSSSADVDIRVGPGFSVIATGSPAALDKLRVRQDGRSIDLGTRRGVSWSSGDRVRFAITMPRIAAAAIGGSGSISVDRVAGDRFAGSIGGSGRLTVNGMQVRRADWSIGGSGNVSAAGHADTSSISIGGSGQVRNAALRSDIADVTISGAGNVAANVAQTAKVTIVGSGDVTITGGARCSVTKMGSGKVHCG